MKPIWGALLSVSILAGCGGAPSRPPLEAPVQADVDALWARGSALKDALNRADLEFVESRNAAADRTVTDDKTKVQAALLDLLGRGGSEPTRRAARTLFDAVEKRLVGLGPKDARTLTVARCADDANLRLAFQDACANAPKDSSASAAAGANTQEPKETACNTLPQANAAGSSSGSDQFRRRAEAVRAILDEGVQKKAVSKDSFEVRSACQGIESILTGRASPDFAEKMMPLLERMAAGVQDRIRSSEARQQAAADDARKQEAKRAERAAFDAARKRCGDDEAGPPPSACVQACKNDEASYECVVLAGLSYDARKVPGDKVKARAMAEAACKAGNPAGCSIREIFRKHDDAAEAKKKAEASLPGLFTKCETNRAAVERWRVAGMSAARARNQAGADEAATKMREIEPQWSQTLDQIQEAIGLVTDNQGPRYEQLIGEVRRRCSCEPTRSGHCRR